MTNYLQQLVTFFRNLSLNSVGVNRSLYQLLQDHDINKALDMMQNNDKDVDEAIREYNPQTHAVMRRPNKFREKNEPYITEKLPRCRQRYINEIELFFLLGKPVTWKKKEGDDEVYQLFMDFLKDQHFNSRIRQAKRLAGAETESAMMFHIYRDDNSGERRIKSLVLARSKGYRLRPLIDQYDNMVAFAYGYRLREGGRDVEHWDFQTADALIYTKKSRVGWDVEIYPNPTGKINLVYFKQPKAWDGAEPRIHREEMLDSTTGDTNNYFSDPIATATADVIDSMVDPAKPGKLIQLAGKNSRFEYVNPPQASQTRDAEKKDLHDSILFDTMTPDFDVEKMRGLGSLSGVAIKNAMTLGYIKRDNRLETYSELLERLINVIKGILKFMHPELADKIDELVIEGEFSEPFADDKQTKWNAICDLYQAGLISLETAVEMLAITDAPQEEIDRIKKAAAEKNDTTGQDTNQADPDKDKSE